MENSRQRVEPRVGQFCQVIKVLAYGCMVESAALFPLANSEALWFRFATLSVFIISSLAFTGLHFESFVRFGQYTIPAAVLIVVFTAWRAGSFQEHLVPWLPLFITLSFLVTVAAHHFEERSIRQRRTSDLEAQDSDIPVGSHHGRSTSPFPSDTHSHHYPSRLGSVDSRLFRGFRPPSEYTPQPGDSDISLSGVPPRVPSHWGSEISGFFRGQTGHPGPCTPDQPQPSAAQGDLVDEVDTDAYSEGGTAVSNQPLLRSRSL